MQHDDDFPVILGDSFVRYWSSLWSWKIDELRWLRLIGTEAGRLGISLAQPDEVDAEHDFLLERDGARFAIDRELAESFRGWQVFAFESLYDDFCYDMLPPGRVSTASWASPRSMGAGLRI